MLASRILLSVWFLLLAAVPTQASASDLPPESHFETLRVVLTNGDTLLARCVLPAPYDMVAVIGFDATTRYVSPTRVRAILDSGGSDWVEEVLDNGETLGEPLPRPVRVKEPPKPLRIGPRSVRRNFLITETSLLGRVDDSPRRGALESYLGFDLGEMINVSDRMAVGYGAFFGSSYEYANAGARLRLLRWLSATSSIEIAPAVIIAEGRPSRGIAVPPGFSLQANWSPSRYITLTTEAFSVRRRDYTYRDLRTSILGETTRDTGILFGVKVGRWPGAAAGLIAAIGWLGQGSYGQSQGGIR